MEDTGDKRILIIDDEPYNCLALMTLLKSLKLKNVSHRVDLVTSGKQAIHSIINSIHPRGTILEVEASRSPSRFVKKTDFGINFESKNSQDSRDPKDVDSLIGVLLDSVR